MAQERIKWIDIYRGIAIILVVVGHATGRFNPLIYQFHMAAFFFISGYMTNYEKRSICTTIRDKFKTLLLPFLIVFLLMICGEGLLEYLGLRKYFFSAELVYIGIKSSIIQFLLYGRNYAWFLGACWFLVVLFWIEILHKMIDSLCRHKWFIYILVSIGIFLCGYFAVSRYGAICIGIIELDLVCIGQLYFALGKVIHDFNILNRIKTKPVILFLLGCLNIWLMFWFTYKYPGGASVDYPSRTFSRPGIEAVAALNGITLVFVISVCLERIKYIGDILIHLGQNTLGIVFFHFMFFKAGYLILILAGVVPASYMQNFVPTADVGDRWWLLLAATSIFCSIMLWNVLKGTGNFIMQSIKKESKG